MKKYDNVFYFKNINSAGGVESMFYYLSRLYKNMVVFYRKADPEQVKRLAKNIEVHQFKEEMQINCKRFFCNYAFDIIDHVKADEYYHIIHCDYKQVWFSPIVYDGFKYIGVSKLACDSFTELTNKEAELIYNPVVLDKPDVKKKEGLHLISATRLTREKGKDRIEKLASMLDKAGVEYDWDIYTDKQRSFSSPNIHIKPCKLDLTKEMAESTYLVQLSDHEAFGLSVCEALTLGTPVIVTDIPAFREIGCKHGKNAVICDLNMVGVDIEMILKGIPKFEYTPPKSNWGKYLDNNSTYNPEDKIEVEIIPIKFTDLVTGKTYKRDDKAIMTKQRASYLEAKGYVRYKTFDNNAVL